MQHLPTMEIAKRILRANICPTCWQRPARSEFLPPSMPRSCEPNCPIFENVEELIQIAAEEGDQRLGNYENLIRDRICNHTCTRETAGDYCSYRLNQSCPLARCMGRVTAELLVVPTIKRKPKKFN